ncbi:response regulator [Paracoccaceae bacterium]|nr:response regulator [Paracoccaceae bacterium]
MNCVATGYSNMVSHLLIVDDDQRIRQLLQKYLVRNGFLVSIAQDAAQAKRLLCGLSFDLIVLDVMMPDQDGLSLTRELRESIDIPILLLTARSESEDRISGFEAGADDYLPKPFEPKELLLRIHAILRRVPEQTEIDSQPKLILLGEVKYDVRKGELWQADLHIRLTGTEAQLMRIFAKSVGQPISRAELMSEMGRDQWQSQDRAIDVQITRLRRKIEANPKEPRYLQTVRGSGYMLASD